MVVFSHNVIPLTSNLREQYYDNDKSSDGTSADFRQLMSVLTKAVRHGTSPLEEMSWDYKYTSLWSSRLIHKISQDTKAIKINIWKCSKETFTGLLATRTYWYKRLPKASRRRVNKLATDSKGRRKLKDTLDTADGVLTSLIFSMPEMFEREGYALSDRIISSVISNCFHNYDRFQKKLKLLRKTVKFHMMSKTEVPLDTLCLRDMSYFTIPLKIFNTMALRSSKEKMFRVAMFTQTRASGLAGQGQIKEAVDDFISTVTEKIEFKPNKLLTHCIDVVTTSLAEKLHLGRNHEFKISMSTSACRESSKRNEGKFGYLKQLVRDAQTAIKFLT
jgi:hypothetical protein